MGLTQKRQCPHLIHKDGFIRDGGIGIRWHDKQRREFVSSTASSKRCDGTASSTTGWRVACADSYESGSIRSGRRDSSSLSKPDHPKTS